MIHCLARHRERYEVSLEHTPATTGDQPDPNQVSNSHCLPLCPSNIDCRCVPPAMDMWAACDMIVCADS